MSLFQGSAPDPVELTKTSSTQAPGYLTDYLTNLAQAGTSALGTVTPGAGGQPGTLTPKTGEQLIAAAPGYYQNLLSGEGVDQTKLPGLGSLTRYQNPLDQALTAGKSAMDVGATDISKFYDPYQQQVIDEMQRQSDINVQRNVLPALKALGIGSGQFGGSRTGAIGGQALADIAASLQAQQTAARSKGFQTALDAALKEQGQQSSAASALSNIGAQEQTAATSGLKTLGDIGAAKLAYDQSKIEAPVKRAQNVAEIMRGYTYPTTSTETAEQFPTIMGTSPLSQIAGLGSLIGAVFPSDPKTGNVGGLGGILRDIFKATPDTSGNVDTSILSDLADFGG